VYVWNVKIYQRNSFFFKKKSSTPFSFFHKIRGFKKGRFFLIRLQEMETAMG